jgi:hypothetical protein
MSECRQERSTGEASVLSLEPVYEEVISAMVRPFNQGYAAVIDATVHATRYVVSWDPDLRWLIDYDLGIIRSAGENRNPKQRKFSFFR